MKITMEFNLPEEKEDFENAKNGNAYYAILHGLTEWLRRQHKYDAGEVAVDAAWAVRGQLSDLLSEYNVDL